MVSSPHAAGAVRKYTERMQSQELLSGCGMAKGWSPGKDECTYTSCYCEENVWKLCDSFRSHGFNIEEIYAVFISNHERMVSLWQQQAGDLAIWDYHVILITRGKETLVYDLDSLLPFPVEFRRYVEDTFKPSKPALRLGWKTVPMRMYRVVPATAYLKEFASDRSHMIDPKDGSWRAAPPSYPPIKTQGCSNNIQEFISMSDSALSPGRVVNEAELLKMFM